VLALILLGVAPVLWAADWVPPSQPDPMTILGQARTDAAAKHYADALAKQVWFHEHALDYAQGLYGVRLSYALNAGAAMLAAGAVAMAFQGKLGKGRMANGE